MEGLSEMSARFACIFTVRQASRAQHTECAQLAPILAANNVLCILSLLRLTLNQLLELASEASLDADMIQLVRAYIRLDGPLHPAPIGLQLIGPPCCRRKLALLRHPAIPADVG